MGAHLGVFTRKGAEPVEADTAPNSPYTLLTPYCSGISAGDATQWIRPVFSNASASSSLGIPFSGGRTAATRAADHPKHPVHPVKIAV